MKIFDFRLRPPSPGFVAGALYERDGALAQIFGPQLPFEPAPSVRERSFEKLFGEMDAAGVERGLVLGRESNIFGSVGNDEILGIVKRAPTRFLGAAAVNPVDWKGAIRLIKDAMDKGFKAVNLEPGISDHPMYIDDRRLYPIYTYCEENRIPMVIMGGGLAGPDVSYTSPIHLDRVCGDFPGLKIAVSHGGWPWVNEILQVAFRRTNLYLSPDCYLCGFPGSADFIRAADGFLSLRTLYASAYPVCPVDAYAKWFQKLPIKKENMERVLYGNAMEFLGIAA